MAHDFFNIDDNDNQIEWPSYDERSLFQCTAIEAAGVAEVAPEMAVTQILSAISLACQGLINVELPTGHNVPTSLCTLTIAESGERKSALQRLIFAAHKDFQNKILDEHKNEIIEYNSKIEIWSIKKKHLQSELRKNLRKGLPCSEIEKSIIELDKIKPELPKVKTIIYEDTTVAGIAEGLNTSFPFSGIVSSEGDSVINGYALRSLSFYNSIWSGDDVNINRKNEKSFTLKNKRLSISLMIQPEILKNYLLKKGEKARGIGFLSRFLVIKPTSRKGKRIISRQSDKNQHIKKFYQRIKFLLDKTKNKSIENTEFETLNFTPSAKEKWFKYSQEIEKEMLEGGYFEHVSDHASKLMDNVSRIAALIHLFENDGNEISTRKLEYAYEICQIYSHNFIDEIAGEPEVVANANKIVSFLLSDKNKFNYYSFTLSEIVNWGPSSVRDKRKAEDALRLIRKIGCLKEDHGKKYTLLLNELYDPRLENGKNFTIKGLPLFDNDWQEERCPQTGKRTLRLSRLRTRELRHG